MDKGCWGLACSVQVVIGMGGLENWVKKSVWFSSKEIKPILCTSVS